MRILPCLAPCIWWVNVSRLQNRPTQMHRGAALPILHVLPPHTPLLSPKQGKATQGTSLTATNRRTVAAPIPDEAPVTSTVCPFKEISWDPYPAGGSALPLQPPAALQDASVPGGYSTTLLPSSGSMVTVASADAAAATALGSSSTKKRFMVGE